MPIISAFQLLKRAPAPAGTAGSTDNNTSATYAAGFSVAGAILLGISIWLAIHFYRRRLAKKRHDNLGSAFLSVRGVVREDQQTTEKNTPLRPNPTPFSRGNINAQIIMPRKAHLGDAANQEKQEIIEYHRQSGSFPKPFSFALHPSTPTTPAMSDQFSVPRNSLATSSRKSRFSIISAASSYNGSLASNNTSTAPSIRKVRQVFNPVLPDELLVTLGEQLMILQSFDDGWCVVGRESGLLMPQPKSLFGGSSRSGTETPTAMFGPESGAGVGTTSGGNVELGMVPAWCFLKQVKGLRAERPVRSSSLGVTVNMDGLSCGRDELISWSNF